MAEPHRQGVDAAPLILVHQMAKVGSLAWVEAARQSGRTVVHCHFLTPGNLETIAGILAATAEDNTIAHPLVARELLRTGQRGAAAIAAARREERPIRLVTGIRDPVARSLSLVQFLADFCGHTGRRLSARDGAEPAAVRGMLRESWEAVLAARAPRGNFERLVWFLIGAYRTWFDEELAGVFGIDVFSTLFPRGEGAQRLGSAGARALAYRTEDMAPPATAEPDLRAAGARHLGAPGFAFPHFNATEARRSWPLYRAVSQGFRLPAAWLDEIYAAPVVRHFYSAEEIETFKDHWAASG